MEPLKCVAFIDLPHRPYQLTASPGGEVIVACSQEGAITLLNSSLGARGSLQMREKVDGIAISPDGEYLGLSLRDRRCVLNARGQVVAEIRHDPLLDWAGGGCAFSPDGRFFWSVRPGGDERAVTLEVTRCDSWQVVATEEFDAEEDGFWTVVPHPEGEVAGLWVGAGQDGQWLYWCGIQDDWLYVEKEPALAWTGPPVFHPAGGEFLTDSLDDERFRRHRFPDGEVIGQLSEVEVFPPDDPDESEMFGGNPLYLSDRRALVLSSNGRLRLIDLKAMRVVGDVALEGRPLKPHRFSDDKRERLYGDVEQLCFLKDGLLLTGHRNWMERPLNPECGLGVWNAASLCDGMTRPEGDRPYTAAFFSHFLR